MKIVNSTMIVALIAVACMVYIICICAYKIHRDNELAKQGLLKEKQKVKGFINQLNNNEQVASFGKAMPGANLEKIFNRAKNPWRMTIATFQFIRFGGLFASILLALTSLVFSYELSIFLAAIGILCFWYPMYYYKAIGDERETEWAKMYEFIWVLQNNLTLYDPAKAYMNTKIYIQEHAPHNLEIIQGFDDFYRYWNPDQIDPYIERYYSFSITREITQIVFNMHQTGDFPEESLKSLRRFIINQQDLRVENTVSGVAGKATIYSLPFMMISVIIALMVPMVAQLMMLM